MKIDLRHPVERAVSASFITRPGDRAIVAVSGGFDSMALIEALRDAPFSVVIAHFDHRLRVDSARDAEHVAAYARSCDLEFVLGSEDVARRARETRRCVEEAAREARYEFLGETATRLHASWVLTAHTRDDLIETVLMRILRGTGRYGLVGIPRRRDIFSRPLLGVTRRETVDYCVARGVAHVDDPTNLDKAFFRNRVRLEILPELRAVYPGVDESLWRMAMHAGDEREEFAATADEWCGRNISGESDGTVAVRADGLQGLDDDTVARFLHAACVKLSLNRDVGAVHYLRLVELARTDQIGASADLPGFSARREHDALVLKRAGLRDSPQGGSVSRARDEFAHEGLAVTSLAPTQGDGACRMRFGAWSVEAEFVAVEEGRRAIAAGKAGDDVAYFDADAARELLVVRPTRPGDRMQPFGMDGHKKLSDLFIDRKVPRRVRERAIVIEGHSIYWVPGVARSNLAPVGDATARVLRLKAVRT